MIGGREPPLQDLIGTLPNRVLLESSIEYRIKAISPEERVARVRELRAEVIGEPAFA